MKDVREFFVQIPNKMFAFETEQFATNDELIVFYTLGTTVQARDTKLVYTSVDLLNSLIGIDNTNPSRGKSKVRKALYGLRKKRYITFDTSEEEIKNNTLLKVFLPVSKDDVYCVPVQSANWQYNGYTEVTDEMFSKIQNIEQLKILIYVKWRSGIHHAISYYEWEKVLNVSHQTAVKLVTQCHELGLIVKQRGDYYQTASGEIRQQTNTYVIPNKDDKSEQNLFKQVNTELNSMHVEDQSIEKRKHNWFNTGPDDYLNENDMYIFHTTECDVLKKHALKRLTAIRNTESGNRAVEKLVKKATERLRKEKREKSLHEYQEQLAENEFIESSKRKPAVYKKQKYLNDISEFLDNNLKNNEEENFIFD